MISVIIPFFNHHEALKESLGTLLAQTEKDTEVIIVDDGSAIPLSKEEVGAVYTRPFTLIRQENAGAPAARNSGFRKSTGQFVIFWDADVLGKPTMLQEMLRALQENKEASFVYSDHYFGLKKMPAKPWSAPHIQKDNFIHSTSLIRREAVVPWDETLKRFQDWDYWLTSSEEKKSGVYIPEVLFSVIPRKSGMSGWLPSFAYKKPFCFFPLWKKQVFAYHRARAVVMRKHGLK